MTFHAYRLPKGAPQKQVWFAVCDACHKATKGPFGNTSDHQAQMKDEIIDAGWRYQREYPMDTCPACLAAESAPDSPPG
ncbi:hypothetical protein [Microbacterium sp. zg-YB36]|uniref:hypothetical protein n=1 Tax=Microbacterium sp. zg-YB36 TaxID=2969407 RepID=UPI00214CF1CB|nr:hypothetical protein [Microbacterium sp. zg-YB36]MDL5351093.1 hypothetical protein [Microbacterium sp. zg-YB36]